MKKGIIITIFFLFFISFVSAGLDECKGVTDKTDIPCYILLPYNGNCTIQAITYYNNASTNLGTFSLAQYNPIKCNSTFNYTTLGTYTFNFTTGETGSIILQEVDEEMASLSITAFVLLINAAFFTIPFFIKIKEHPVLQGILKKMIWIFAIALLALNTGIMGTIAETAGLDVTGELFNIYLWLFTKSIYITLLIMLGYTVISSIKQWGKIQALRIAEDDGNNHD